MKQLPDDHFQRRLKDHQQVPPASAWHRIEKNLPGKYQATWIKVAAAVLLLFTASAVIWSVRDDGDEHRLADQQAVPDHNADRRADPADKPMEEQEATAKIDTPQTQERHQDVSSDQPAEQRNTSAERPQLPSTPRSMLAKNNPDSHDTARVQVGIDSLAAGAIAAVSAEETTDIDKPIKLVLDADEVRAKYLRNKSVADATESDTKTSGLKKLLDKANDISNQDPIGDLRQMKNDIFALNFQGKKRDQRK